ncbi:MAG: tetratricopeptide repeat protein [Deltaproteobacteria bacterium]
MKRLFFILLGIILAFGSINAQDAKSMYKKAKKLLSNYYFNPSENAKDLGEATALINQVLLDTASQSDWKVWQTKGQIFNEFIGNEVKMKILNPNYVLQNPGAGLEAFDALKKAMMIADKPKFKEECLKTMVETENHLNNVAAYEFQDKKYQSAYDNFSRTLEAYDLFKANNQEKDSRLADSKIRSEQKLYTGYSAFYGEKKENALKYFKDLADENTDQPFVYEALYTINAEMKNPTDAVKYLTLGRNKFPEDTGLLYAEINYYIKEGKLNELIEKLEKAIEIDPKNVSVYTTLGSVYDQLNTKAFESGDTVLMKSHFANALKYFNKALELEPNNFDAVYSIGALYYNSAANYTKEINKYANDFTSAGTKKYNDLRAKMLDLFSTAKPYFEKAYGIDEKDLGVLQALSEIYARQDKLEEAKFYKTKLEEAKAQQGK